MIGALPPCCTEAGTGRASCRLQTAGTATRRGRAPYLGAPASPGYFFRRAACMKFAIGSSLMLSQASDSCWKARIDS